MNCFEKKRRKSLFNNAEFLKIAMALSKFLNLMKVAISNIFLKVSANL